MKIGIDARLLNERITGITRYLINVLKYLPYYDSQNNYSLFAYSKTKFDKNFYIHHLVKDFNLPRQIKEHFWLNLSLPRLLKENNIDLFFTPYVLVPFKRSTQKNVIVIHDVMTKTCPQFFTDYYKKYMSVIVPQSIKRADAIVTVSQSAKNDIVKFYDVHPDKITVTHIWTDEKYKPLQLNEEEKEFVRKKYNLPDKFILYVGAIEERKNILGILKIADILKSRDVDMRIVLVGNKGFGFEKLSAEMYQRNDRIIHIEHIAEENLPSIYNLAEIFLFPSFYEGFGLPPLEAMKCGLPVITGKNSALLEVVGEGGLLLDSEDYSSFADNIILLLNDQTFYDEMKLKALKQAEKFKPDNEIVKLVHLFNSLGSA
jgi:glycosyltransferase involved in cell wall biosynthesis